MSKAGRLLLLCIALSLFTLISNSCAPMHPTVTPEVKAKFIEDLKVGKLALTCEVACLWSWVGNFEQMIALHNSSQWEQLAELVMQVGFEQDIAYYFLGRAAEGFGYLDSAEKYYQRSLYVYNAPNTSVVKHCREVESVACGGIDLAKVLPERLALVGKGGIAPSSRKFHAKRGTSSLVSSNNRFKFIVKGEFPKEEISEYVLEIYYRDLKVADGGGVAYSSQQDELIDVLDDTPTYGCQTIMALSYAGSAHDDCSYHMAISCGLDDYLYEGYAPMCSVDLKDIDGDGVKELLLSDPSFIYYNPDRTGPEGKHFLPFAESPEMNRYGVWTAQGWKITSPGDLSTVYAKHLKEASSGEKDAGSAIAAAYYALMSGQDSAKAKKILDSRLPNQWKSISKKVFADIQSAVSMNNLIERKPLR